MIIAHFPCECCGKPMTPHPGEDDWHFQRRRCCNVECSNRLRSNAAQDTRKHTQQVSQDTTNAVFEQICLAAQSGSPCPSNVTMAETLECSSRAVQEAIRRLRIANKITTTQAPRRQITIISGPLSGAVVVTEQYRAPAPKRPMRPEPAIRLGGDSLNYGQGFKDMDPPPRDGGPARLSKPLAHTAGGVGRYF